jgi:hypothetical protein
MKIHRKEFTQIFQDYYNKGTQIWVVSRMKELDHIVIKMAIKLAKLEFINYIRICDQYLAASSECHTNKPKVPITDDGHESAIGIEIIYDLHIKTIDFCSINSPIKGHGGRMVDAIMSELPLDWQPAVIIDWSNGFWDKMEEKYNQHKWMLR